MGYSPDGKRRIRRKVTGRTKTEVKDKLKIVHSELDARIQSAARYTKALCIEDWLSQGLTNRSPSTVANYRWLADHAVAKLGAIRLKDLTAKHVQVAASLSNGNGVQPGDDGAASAGAAHEAAPVGGVAEPHPPMPAPASGRRRQPVRSGSW